MRWKTKLTAAAIAAATTMRRQPDGRWPSYPLTNKGGINPDSWVYGPRN